MKTRTKYILLTLIIILAAVLRLYQLGAVPPSPDWDEVALGYNGYSILHTGKDEFGKVLPVVLRSFDDYKPALYTYLTIPPIAIFGLNLFATRLPSAVFGILTVLAVYFLVKELFDDDYLALLSALLLAISPWHLQFSRTAFETNVGLAFNIFTALFFVKGLKKPWLLSLAAICSALAIYTYQSEKVFTPLLVIALTLVYLRPLVKLPRKYLAAAVVCGAIAIAPMLFYIATNKQALLRAQATMAFSDKTSFLQGDIPRLEADRAHHDILGLIFDNRRVLYLMTGVSGYLSHFSLNWLFLTGDLNRHHAPGMGILYLWELPFFFIGLYQFLFNRKKLLSNKQGRILLLAWFLLAPVPAAFTSGVPHAVRTLNFLPTFQVFIATGILTSFFLLRGHNFFKNNYRFVTYALLTVGFLLIAFNVGYYLNQYFVQQNYFYSEDWQYGHEQEVAYVKQIAPQYDKIVVSDSEPLDKSYMFYAFYLQYPPAEYQKESTSHSGGFAVHQSFGKYVFRTIDWSKEEKSPSILYVGRPQDFGGDANVLKTIYYLNGEPAIKIVQG